MSTMFVIATGNPFDGMELTGPFVEHDDAVQHAERNLSEAWDVVTVKPITPDRITALSDGPTKPTTNAELLMECMEYSRFGPLAQAFIIDAVTKLAEAVAEADPAELAQQMEISPVHPASWQGVAKEIKAKFDKFYNREREHG